ncbi:hypothetical protein C5167_005820 [Papaver somniferum]|uniref:Uncharacterized protein n=1 Tax=Papaver somniferum TaxID=3469 RepID=A0A4Y7JFT5_PAPSO|nr:hypothetical protein C5167_005820 [Papaver somniferum]
MDTVDVVSMDLVAEMDLLGWLMGAGGTGNTSWWCHVMEKEKLNSGSHDEADLELQVELKLKPMELQLQLETRMQMKNDYRECFDLHELVSREWL